MKPARILSLGLVLSLCSVAAGTALPAVAASQSVILPQPAWSGHGDFSEGNRPSSIGTHQSVVFTQQALRAPAGELPMLQVRVAGMWKDAGRVRASSDGSYRVTVGRAATVRDLRGAPGSTVSLRLQWKASERVPKDWASNTKTVSFAKNAPQLSASYPFGTKKSFTADPSSSKSFTVAADPATKFLQVQRYDTSRKSWITSRSLATTGLKNGKAHFSVPLINFGAGETHQFRLHVPSQSGVNTWTGAAQRVTWPKSASSLSSGLFSSLQVVSSTGGQSVDARVSGMGKRPVQLQQYVNKKWVVKSTVKASESGNVRIALPKLGHNSSAQFRLYAPATAKNVAVGTASVKVKYQDPRKVTGLAKEVRELMKSRCSTATVSLAPKAKFKGWAGSAYGNQNRILIYQHMNRNRGDWKPFIRYIAQHECAHILTHQAAAKAGVNAQVELNRLFKSKGNDGVERMADAMAFAWSGSVSNSYYTKSFTKAQMSAAKEVLGGHWF